MQKLRIVLVTIIVIFSSLSLTDVAKAYYKDGVDGYIVNVCGDTTPNNRTPNWSEHDAGLSCGGCSRDDACRGYDVQVFKCYAPSQIDTINGTPVCKYQRENSFSSVELYSKWFTNPNELVQINVYNKWGVLQDYIVWEGKYFRNKMIYVTPSATPVGQGYTYGYPASTVNNSYNYNNSITINGNNNNASINVATGVNNTPSPTPIPNPIGQINGSSCYNPDNYLDVNNQHLYYDYIHNLTCEGIINGYNTGYFMPSQPITRGEIAKVISKGFNISSYNSCGEFRDVSRSNVFYEYIMSLKCSGVINGYRDNTYRPNELVTRAEAMKMIINAMNKSTMGTYNRFYDYYGAQLFLDVPTSNVFMKYINASFLYNMSDPNYPSDMFRPDNYITREEMAFYINSGRNVTYSYN